MKKKNKIWIPIPLCFDCKKQDKRCDIKDSLKAFDVRNKTTSIIWNCPEFEEKEKHGATFEEILEIL